MTTEAISSEWGGAARAALSEAGYRAGGARETVIGLLEGQACCLSAHEIEGRLRASGDSVGLASVYRALDVLHGLGLVQRVDLGQGVMRYEPVVPGGDHHHHAVCEACGAVTRFEDPELEADLARIGRGIGHTVAEHEVVLRGTCGRCEHEGPA